MLEMLGNAMCEVRYDYDQNRDDPFKMKRLKRLKDVWRDRLGYSTSYYDFYFQDRLKSEPLLEGGVQIIYFFVQYHRPFDLGALMYFVYAEGIEIQRGTCELLPEDSRLKLIPERPEAERCRRLGWLEASRDEELDRIAAGSREGQDLIVAQDRWKKVLQIANF